MKMILATVAVAAMLASQAKAEPYTLFIYEDAVQLALRPGKAADSLQYWSAYDVYGKELAAAGVLRGGSAIDTSTPVTLVTATKSDPSQPDASSELALGGYFQLDVASQADAIAWARKAPIAGDGLVEVRGGYPVPGMKM